MVTRSVKKILLVLVGIWIVSACENKDQYAVENYIKQEKISQYLDPLLPYIAKLENGVSYDNRFDTSAFNKKYFLEQQNKYKFSFERYFITKDSVHYFLIWKVAPSLYEKKIAIGGRYKKDQNGKIYTFEELFNTPKMKLDELKEKSFPLFDYIVENGNVEKYYGNYDLVEFPDGKCTYDKEKHRWILTNNERWTYTGEAK